MESTELAMILSVSEISFEWNFGYVGVETV